MSRGGDTPFLSIVVPTHNRRDMIVRVLGGIFRQDYPRNRMEVIAVLDGCTDDTDSLLRALNPPCKFLYVSLPKSGPAAARNKGIQLSIGEVIVFLDDDVEPTEGFLRAHAALHTRADNLVVQGYCPFPPWIKRSLHFVTATRWWEQNFDRLAQPGRKLGPQDLCTGNLSIRRKHLLSVGGFDEAFCGYGNEDYELGARLASQGLEFRFCREALAWHHCDTPLAKSLARTREEARADVIYGRKHPHLKRTFRLFTFTQEQSLLETAIRVLAFRFPQLGNYMAGHLLSAMGFCERFGLREKWARINWALRRYYYWRGVKDSLGSYAALKEYLGDEWIKDPAIKRTKVISIDLTHEIPAIEGLSSYKAVYILFKDGTHPLAWSLVESPGDWLSPKDIVDALERQSRLGEGRDAPEPSGLADSVLPALSKKRLQELISHARSSDKKRQRGSKRARGEEWR